MENYAGKRFFKLSQLSGSNRRPDDYKSTALPTELSWLKKFYPQNSLAGLLQGFSICPLFAGRAVFGGAQRCAGVLGGKIAAHWRRVTPGTSRVGGAPFGYGLRRRSAAAFSGGVRGIEGDAKYGHHAHFKI